MKKHLIAAAVAGAFAVPAMAQVTLSGNVGYAYETFEQANEKSSGIRNTDGQLVATVNEDLGGGLSVVYSGAVQWGRHRDAAVTFRDSTITLRGGFGSLMIGSVEAGNGIQPLGGAGAPVRGLGDETYSGLATRAISAPGAVDTINFTLPKFGGVTVNVQRAEVGAARFGEKADDVKGGTAWIVGATYASGPITARIDQTWFADVTALNNDRDRTRISGNVNLGAVVIGAGYQTIAYKGSANVGAKDENHMIVGVNVPMGALAFGVNYTTNEQKERTGGDITGLDLGVAYSLSKRTTLGLQHQQVENDANAEGTMTRVRLLHSF